MLCGSATDPAWMHDHCQKLATDAPGIRSVTGHLGISSGRNHYCCSFNKGSAQKKKASKWEAHTMQQCIMCKYAPCQLV